MGYEGCWSFLVFVHADPHKITFLDTCIPIRGDVTEVDFIMMDVP
jgi:hypothetical protein